MENYDIAGIGGGASGLPTALASAESGKKPRVAVLEKTARVGKKLLLTGNGRCNLTNTSCAPEHYHGDTAAAMAVLHRFPPEKAIAFFRAHGLLCRELEEGRVYPYTLQASSLLNALRRGLAAAGAAVLCDFPVSRAESVPGGFAVYSGGSAVRAARVILACGGKACPQSGSDGGGYALAGAFGHRTVRPFPALVQLRTDPKLVRPLKGVRCMARVSLLSGGKLLRETSGEVQFAEGALSGICIFDLSRFAGGLSAGAAEISLDLAPGYGADELSELFRAQAAECPDEPASSAAEGVLCKPLAAETVRAALGGVSVPAGRLAGKDFFRIAAAAKALRFPVLGTLPWQNAQVTAGGVPLSETDENLQSRFRKGLYFCGELLNADGDCGGFNLQWAWASGLTAGVSAADSLLSAREGK